MTDKSHDLNTILARGGENLNDTIQSSKVQMPGVCLEKGGGWGGGVLKLRVDRHFTGRHVSTCFLNAVNKAVTAFFGLKIALDPQIELS